VEVEAAAVAAEVGEAAAVGEVVEEEEAEAEAGVEEEVGADDRPAAVPGVGPGRCWRVLASVPSCL